MQQDVVELINDERRKAELNVLDYDNNSIAQRYAESILETGDFKHNPALPRTMGENIDIFTSTDAINASEVVTFMIFGQVHDDAVNDWGNRDNVYYENYEKVSVGIAFDETTLYLVLNFS